MPILTMLTGKELTTTAIMDATSASLSQLQTLFDKPITPSQPNATRTVALPVAAGSG